MRKSLLFAALVGVGSMAQPAAAADVLNGVTFAELEAALSVGLVVQAAETSKGNKFIIAQGKQHIIAAQLIDCGGETRCYGVRYFAILEKAPSATLINTFNRGPNYSKVALNEKGDGVISLDHFSRGGVTAENLLRNAAVLMVGMSALGGSGVVASADKPGQTVMLSFDDARAQEGLVKAPPGTASFKVDPALARLIMEQAEAAPR